MWIFKNNAFVSIVEDKDFPDQLWVRARIRGDLERFFEEADWLDVIETPDADYRFRCAVDRNILKSALLSAVDAIDYTNFKNSIGTSAIEEERHSAYLKVWSAMMAFQRWALARSEQRRQRRKKGKKKGARA